MKNHNPESVNPRVVLEDYPELLGHTMIGAFIRDHRNTAYWNPVHLDVGDRGVKP